MTDAGPRNGSKPIRIGIVGAGIAGLNAALTLQEAGYPSTIFEASNWVGGRMHSVHDGFWQNGQTSEWCAEFIDSSHVTVLRLAQRFGLPVVDILAGEAPGSHDTYFVHNHRYPYSQAFRDFQPVRAILESQIRATGYPTNHTNFTPFAQKLDHISVYDWIATFVPGGHESDLGALVNSVYHQEYGLGTALQSSLNLVYLLGHQASPDAFSVYGQSDERYRMPGRIQQLPLALASHLRTAAPCGNIEMQWRMISITANNDHTISCDFSTPSGMRNETFDHLIVTIPFSVLRKFDIRTAGFDELKTTAINQLGYGITAKLAVQFKTRFWNDLDAGSITNNGIIFSDLPFENAWDATRAQPGESGIIVMVIGGSKAATMGVSGAFLTTRESSEVAEHACRFVHHLDTIWPGAAAQWNGLAALSTPGSNPNLRGSYSCWKVGQYTQFSGYERVRQGNVHFAGEHCSHEYQGFMEGAAQEGARAAVEIISDHRASGVR